MSLCLPERKRANEVRDPVWAREDCRTPLLDTFAAHGDLVEEVMSRSDHPCRRDQGTGLKRLAVVGKPADDGFHEFLRRSHLLGIVQT